jgi:D-3-phosphoglycerate dehydrogenase
MESSGAWAALLTLEVGEGEGAAALAPGSAPALRLAGSTAHGRPHLAAIDGFEIDAELAGRMLVTRHRDQPGIVGAVGTILADAAVNISSLELSRLSEHGEAMMFVRVDQPVAGPLLARLGAVPGMLDVRVVELPPL